MKVYFDARQLGHAPQVYFRRGAAMPHQEQPQRAEILRDMLLFRLGRLRPKAAASRRPRGASA